jgi:hypothetical protein
MQKLSILVRAYWDDEAKVWVATSDDVPGLESNQELAGQFLPEVPLLVMSEQITKVRLRTA